MQERKMEEDMSAGLDQSKREEKLQQGVVRRQRSVEYKKEKETMAMGLFREGRTSHSDTVLRTVLRTLVHLHVSMLFSIKMVRARTHTKIMMSPLSLLMM